MKAQFLALVVLFGTSLGSAQAAPRTWTSKDGTATLTATFHKVEGETVVLTLANGRSQKIARSFLSDADLTWIAQNSAALPLGAAAPSQNAAPLPAIPAALKGKLIDAKGQPFNFASEGAPPKFYLFYYSASWCGPCRAFTPELVRFANRLKNASFSVILVPSDQSLEDEIAYLSDYKMPWPGIKLGTRTRDIPGNPGNGIPAARLTDAEGKTLLTTAEMSRSDFLDEARKIVNRSETVASN